jgi:hypothetical protein
VNPLLILTHLLAAGMGSAVTYVAVIRLVRVREVDGHAVFEINHTEEHQMSNRRRPNWLGVVILVASALVIGIGVQAYLNQRAGDAQDSADRRYADCLTGFAADLVTTIQDRAEANKKVATAERARDDAVDQVLDVVDRGRQVPPKATEKDFDKALQQAVLARRHLDRVQAHADRVLAKNQYVLPQAVCSR